MDKEEQTTEEKEAKEEQSAPVAAELESFLPRNPFDSPQYKKKVEKSLKPMNVMDLLEKGRLYQKVDVGKSLSVTFITLEAGVEVLIDKMAYERANINNQNYQKISTMAQLAASMVLLDDKPFGGLQNMEYDPEKEKEYYEYLEKKLKLVSGLNTSLVMLLSTHQVWFTNRVIDLIKTEFVEALENF
jgi:hypothetical protein